MKLEEIDLILAKRITGEASSSEISFLESWKEESFDNQMLYNEYAAIWDASSNYEPSVPNFDFHNALENHLDSISTPVIKLNTTNTPIVNKKQTSIFSIKRISSIAAIFVLAIASVFVLDSFSTTTISAGDSIQFASLEDGSKIWLDKGSSVSFKKDFGKSHREIELVGKAFFDVSRNEDLPFEIDGGDLEVSVLGTSFTVDLTLDKQEVTVTTGKVAVASQNDNVILEKGDKVTLTDAQLVEGKTDLNVAKWRNEALSFNESPIEQVIADINLFHNNKIVLDNQLTTNCLFTSTYLASEPFQNIVDILEVSYDLEVTSLANGQVKLTVTNCN